MVNISIVKGNDRKSNIKKSLELIEKDIKKSIMDKKSKELFIKINTMDINYPQANTDPKAIEAVIEYFSKYFDKIIIGDNSSAFKDSKKNIYTYLKKKYDVQFSYLTEFGSKTINFETINGDVEGKITLLTEKAYTITLALPKSHDIFVYTGCSKNMVGCILQNRPYMHGLGDHNRVFLKKIVKANTLGRRNLMKIISLMKPDLAILDAFTGMENNNVDGNVFKIGLAFSSLDCNALDCFVGDLFGFGYIPYLKKAGNIDILKYGFDDLDKLKVNFKKHYLHKIQLMKKPEGYLFPLDMRFVLSIIKRPHIYGHVFKVVWKLLKDKIKK